jgi:uncharacterized protein involved in exopolysaccharide biosynthesis
MDNEGQSNSVANRPVYRSEGKSLFVSFLELFFRRWILICGIFFVVTFWSWYSLSRAPDTYRATGQVMIRRGTVDAVRGTPILRQQEEVGSEIDILKSLVVLDEVVSQLFEQAQEVSLLEHENRIFGLFEPTRPGIEITMEDLPTDNPARLHKILSDRVQIAKFGESNVIEISMIWANPRFAAAAVNAMIDVYEKYHLSVDLAPGQAAFFDREINDVDSQINTLQDVLAKLKKEKGIVDIEKQTELLTLRRHALLSELDELQVDMAGIERDLIKIDQTDNLLAMAVGRDDPSLRSLRQGLFMAEYELAELKSQYQIDNPIVIAKVDEVREIRAQVVQEAELIVERQRHLLTQYRDKERRLQAKINGIEAQMREIPELQAQVDRLDRDIKQRTLNRVDLVEQMFRSTTMERRDQSLNKVRILGFADVPPFPREARRMFKLSVAVILSIVASVVAALFVEGLDHTVSRREEIEEKLEVPYLASIGTHRR